MSELSKITSHTNQLLGLYKYDSSTNGDAIGDTRKSNRFGKIQFETCMATNAIKGAGTWIVTKMLLTLSMPDNNMTYTTPPVPDGPAGAFVALLNGKSGFGRVIIGDAQEYSDFVFKADGTVTLINPSANVVTTETDAKLCITDGGSIVYIINELSSTLVATIEVNYNS
jgi:hypothetical protein